MPLSVCFVLFCFVLFFTDSSLNLSKKKLYGATQYASLLKLFTKAFHRKSSRWQLSEEL